MANIEGVDYSFSKPGGAALQAAGKHFAVRYLSSNPKGLRLSEIEDLHAHGIAIALVFEGGTDRVLYGSTYGSNDASLADKLRKNLGLPELPIYFAVDFDANAGQQSSVDAYLRGAAAVVGANRVGVYGSYGVVERCRSNGTAKYLWQTYAWSHGKVLDGIHLYQYKNGQRIAGAAVDFCRALQDNYGQTITSPAPAAPTTVHLGSIQGVKYMRINLSFPGNLVSGKAHNDYCPTDIDADKVISGPHFIAAHDHWDDSPDLQGVNINGKLRVKMASARPAGAGFGFYVVVTE